MTSALRLRRVLPEFEAPVRARSAPPAWTLLDRAPPLPAPADRTPPPDPAASAPEPSPDVIGEAVAAALAEAEARHARALADVGTRAAADLAAARERWAAEEGRAIADRLAEAVASAGEGVAEAVAELLEPFVGEAARRLAVEELREAVEDLVAGGTGGRIAISGPADLLEALAASLGRSGVDGERLDLAPGDKPEVTITADNSVVRTRLDAWMRALRGRLGSAP